MQDWKLLDEKPDFQSRKRTSETDYKYKMAAFIKGVLGVGDFAVRLSP